MTLVFHVARLLVSNDIHFHAHPQQCALPSSGLSASPGVLIGSVCGHWSRGGPDGKGARVDGHGLGRIVGLVDAYEAVGQLEHVVAQADDDKLRVLGALLDVVRHNAHVLEVCAQSHRNAAVSLCLHSVIAHRCDAHTALSRSTRLLKSLSWCRVPGARLLLLLSYWSFS